MRANRFDHGEVVRFAKGCSSRHCTLPREFTLPHPSVFQRDLTYWVYGVHWNFIYHDYAWDMPNYRERSNGERPDEFRIGQRRAADSGSDMSRGEVLLEEPPGIGREDLLPRLEWQLALRIVASK